MLARILVGVGESGCTPTAHSWLSDAFPASKRAMALSMYATGVPIGIIVGTIGGGWVAGQLGWRAGLFAVGLPGVALAALIALTTQEPRRGQFDGGGVAHQPVGFKTTMTTLVANHLFLSVMIGAACSAVGLYSLSIFTVPLLIRAFNLPLFEAATVFGLSYGISGVIGASIGGFVTDWAGARDPRWYAGVPSISVLAGGLLLISALFQQDQRLFIGLFVCGSVLVNIAVGPSFAIVYNRVGAGMRASASALILLLCNLVGLGVGPTAVGFLSDEFAAKAFSAGAAFAFACPGGHAAPAAGEALHLACASASFHGLQRALALAACFYLLSGVMYFISAQQIGMESAGAASDAPNAVHEPAANP
jgi:predicted MFS family arabinose efflux permease